MQVLGRTLPHQTHQHGDGLAGLTACGVDGEVQWVDMG